VTLEGLVEGLVLVVEVELEFAEDEGHEGLVPEVEVAQQTVHQ